MSKKKSKETFKDSCKKNIGNEINSKNVDLNRSNWMNETCPALKMLVQKIKIRVKIWEAFQLNSNAISIYTLLAQIFCKCLFAFKCPVCWDQEMNMWAKQVYFLFCQFGACIKSLQNNFKDQNLYFFLSEMLHIVAKFVVMNICLKFSQNVCSLLLFPSQYSPSYPFCVHFTFVFNHQVETVGSEREWNSHPPPDGRI